MRKPSNPLMRRTRRAVRSAPPASGGPVAPTAEYVGRRGRRGGAKLGAGSSGLPRRQRSSPLVRRVVLTILICASMGLVTASYRGGVVIHSAQMQVLDVVAPIERGMSSAWDPIAGSWSWSRRTVGATNEIPKLEQENAELRTALWVAESQASENRELRRLLSLEDTGVFPAGVTPVHAEVFSRASGAVDRSLLINVGSNDGVQVDDAVRVAEGLIGRVTAVTGSSARVGLILDQSQSVTAQVVGSDAQGVLQVVSSTDTPVFQLKLVSQSAVVDEFDLVETSGFYDQATGLGSYYPKGIPIGEVTSVSNNPGDLYKTVQIVPYADFENIHVVTVLTSKDGRSPAFEIPPAKQAVRGVSAARAKNLEAQSARDAESKTDAKDASEQ